MSRRVMVVGSGPSGVHFALTAIRKGYEVTMVDVGRRGEAAPLPEARFDQLKDQLPDSVGYFLGERFEGLVLPDTGKEYYGIPPSKSYVFEAPPSFGYASDGMEPLFSFARGGLAEAWTAGCYPYNQAELEEFPLTYADLEPWYTEVSRRIGVTGESDDLARFMPVHGHLQAPLTLDPHSALLMERYRRRKDVINRAHGAYFGRTRVATLSAKLGDREPCGYLGRCLWGCPSGALYTPSHTLRELERQPGFRYVGGIEALHFKVNSEGRVTALVGRPADGGLMSELPVERLVLAAGTLASATIVLRSVREATGEDLRLGGIMDNRQVLVPFFNARMLGRAVPASSYQYHLIGMGIAAPNPAEYVHCQITTLKTALTHPIIQSLPLDLATSAAVARATRAALGIVNVNFHDRRREGNTLSLDQGSSQLRIRYAPPADEPARLKRALTTIRKVLFRLGCIVPPGMQHVRPMGASVHYAGVLPMSVAGGPWTTTPEGRCRAFSNLYLADGSTFPFLPAKNLTFTLMANAARMADRVLDA